MHAGLRVSVYSGYKFVICATLGNVTHTHREKTHRQALTGYTISSARLDKKINENIKSRKLDSRNPMSYAIRKKAIYASSPTDGTNTMQRSGFEECKGCRDAYEKIQRL